VAARIVCYIQYLREIMFSFLLVAAMDISADLHELTRCPVGLVSAGVKSILDIRRYDGALNFIASG
jgi:pseudouridine-5'-phosphate glycosidase/pseudouridine kinase